MAGYGFTFGRAYNLRDNYVLVEAPSESEAREIFTTARSLAGRLRDSHLRWAFCYPEQQMLEIAERHGLTPVDITTPIDWYDIHNPVE